MKAKFVNDIEQKLEELKPDIVLNVQKEYNRIISNFFPGHKRKSEIGLCTHLTKAIKEVLDSHNINSIQKYEWREYPTHIVILVENDWIIDIDWNLYEQYMGDYFLIRRNVKFTVDDIELYHIHDWGSDIMNYDGEFDYQPYN